MVGALYLIRHGSTGDDGGEKRYKGSLDVPLSPAGEDEIRRTSKFVMEHLASSGRKLSAVYCSDLQRAKRSAEILTSTLSFEPIVMPGLRERNFGEWEGMTFHEIEVRWPDAFRNWAADPLNHSPMGGETTLQVSARVDKALDEVLNRHDGDAIAIVAHGGVNRAMLCRFMGVPLENIFRIEQDHGAVSVVEFHNGYPVVKLLNYSG